MEKQFEKLLRQAAMAAGKLIKERFHTTFKIEHKEGLNNLVTEIDKQSEQLIREMIAKAFPDHGIIGEEMEMKETKNEFQWIVDPIDGTTNFARGIPLCCVSIGLMQGKEIIMGAVYNPMLDEFFFAGKGKGAFLNDIPIKVSQQSAFEHAFIVTGFPYHFPEEKGDITEPFQKLVKMGIPVRRLGSAALDLCWVACGRFDGFWEYNLQPWDVAAGYLILREAGGRVSNFTGDKGTVWDGETLATNGLIHETLRSYVIQR